MLKDITEIKEFCLKHKGGAFRLEGRYMEPYLKEGSEGIVEPVNAEHIKVGDIIVFTRGNDVFICHRVLGRFKRDGRLYFWEKGDRSRGVGCFAEDEIVGRLRYIAEGGKLKKPDYYVDGKIILFFLVDLVIRCYLKIAALITRYIFFGRKNIISHFLGTLVWRFHYFCFNRVANKR